MKIKDFLIQRIHSFKYAFQGFAPVFANEKNIYIHSIAAILVIIAGFIFCLSPIEWIAIIISIGVVFICEFINSAIENLADFISIEKHDSIKKVKDISAAAVLISAIMAICIGFIIFIPKMF
jgi:diacylglycerol kinase